MDIFQRQYDKVTENRGNIETFVLGTLLENLECYMDYKLKESDFIIDKCKFFFSLGKTLSKMYYELDELSVSDFINKDRELRTKYNEYGGWEAIKKAMTFSNRANMDGYVDDLYKNNFLIKRGKKEIFTRTIETDGIELNPWEDLFQTMSCKEVEEYFNGDLAKDAVAVINNNIKSESLILSKKEISRLKEGVNKGTPYDIIFEYTEKEVGISNDETPKFVYANPIYSKTTNGLGNGNGITTIAGYSGLGKSTWTFLNMILPMVYRGEVCGVFSNEQKALYFKSMLYNFIAANVFKYYKLSRNKIENGEWNEEEGILIDKITAFLERRNFYDMVHFYSLEEFDVGEIIRISKGLISHQGASVFLVDTFKSEDSSDMNYVGEMMKATINLDSFGQKFDVKVICTMQLTPGSEMQQAYLRANLLAECKKVKTVCDLLFLMRDVVNELELDPSNKKYYLQPYKLKKKARVRTGGSEWEEEEIKFNEKEMGYSYRLIFLDKSRRGEKDIVMLMRFNNVTSKFEEIGLCKRVHRGTLG